MNVLKILLFLTVSITTSCAQQTPQQAVQSPKKTPQISFKIEGYTEGVAQLIGVYADANYLADSAKIATDGSFQFVKPEGYFDGFFYVMLPDQTNFQVLVANGEKGIIRAKRGDILNTLQVEQSLENKLFYENQRFQMGLEQRFNAVAAEMKKSMPSSPKLDSLRAVQQNLLKEREGILTDLKEKYPDKLCRIWSGQWSSWWLPNYQGYTDRLEHAGIYTVSEAYEAIYHCGIEKKVKLQLI